MKTPEKGPRVIAIQDHLDMAKHFTFAVSTDEGEIAKRRELAGRGININDDQTAGTDVAATTLETLEDSEDRAVWAQVVGGAALNTAMHLLRGVGPRRMYRNFTMTKLFANGMLIPIEQRQAATMRDMRSAQITSEGFSRSKEMNRATQRDRNRVARDVSRAAMGLGIYDLELPADISEADAMELAKERQIRMQAQAIVIGLETGYNPTLAQLRSEASPLGAHIVGSPRKYSPRIIKQFREASREAGAPRGY